MNRLTEEYDKNLVVEPNDSRSNYLEKKLLQTFNSQTQMIVLRKQTIVAPSGELALTDSDFESIRNRDILQEAALILRAEMNDIKSNELPENITVKHLRKGECKVPKKLSDFYATLPSGTSSRRQNTVNKKKISVVILSRFHIRSIKWAYKNFKAHKSCYGLEKFNNRSESD